MGSRRRRRHGIGARGRRVARRGPVPRRVAGRGAGVFRAQVRGPGRRSDPARGAASSRRSIRHGSAGRRSGRDDQGRRRRRRRRPRRTHLSASGAGDRVERGQRDGGRRRQAGRRRCRRRTRRHRRRGRGACRPRSPDRPVEAGLGRDVGAVRALAEASAGRAATAQVHRTATLEAIPRRTFDGRQAPTRVLCAARRGAQGRPTAQEPARRARRGSRPAGGRRHRRVPSAPGRVEGGGTRRQESR